MSAQNYKGRVMTDSDLTIRLSLLEQDMKRVNVSLMKIEESAEKHRENHSQITDKIYNRMEELRGEFKKDIDELKKTIDDQIKSQNEILNQIHSKLSDLDKWRWIVVGVASAVGFISSKIIGLFSLNLN